MTTIESELASMGPDSHHLTVLPFWYGERSPGWSTDARAAIVGLSAATQPVHIARACLESIACRLALVADSILEASPTVTDLIASGNALLSSPTWLQILADVLARPIRASAEPEATSRGIALMALRGLGVIRSYEQLPASFGAIYRPSEEIHTVYRKALHRQQELYAQLISR
jgi:gluconokinase